MYISIKVRSDQTFKFCMSLCPSVCLSKYEDNLIYLFFDTKHIAAINTPTFGLLTRLHNILNKKKYKLL